MHRTFFASFFESSPTVIAMCAAGVVVLALGLWFARSAIVRERGLEKVVALGNTAFAAPLAVFGALHLWSVDFVLPLVPAYMPWRLFLAYFVGGALIAASLSIATKIQVRWSGLLLGAMMLLFVGMLDIPAVAAAPGERLSWTLTLRELSFGSGGWLFAACSIRAGCVGWRAAAVRVLVVAGRVVIGATGVFYGVQHFLHPLSRPGVPLEKMMPEWIPGRVAIGFLTGAILVAAGVLLLLGKKTRIAATVLGGWLLLLVVFIYGPILFAALGDPDTGAKIEGINYFFDTLLFAGAVLAVASAEAKD